MRLSGLAQKSSEGRVSLAGRSIGFFDWASPPFFGSFFGPVVERKQKEQNGKEDVGSKRFGLS